MQTDAADQPTTRYTYGYGSALRAEAEIIVDAGLSLADAHDLAHHAEAHLLVDVHRLTAATVHASPSGAHPLS